jgi:ABC-type phosphate transport system permease subunit
VVSFLWVCTIIGSLFGTLVFIVGVVFANGAPQEAAASAMAVALAVIPYVLARSAEALSNK